MRRAAIAWTLLLGALVAAPSYAQMDAGVATPRPTARDGGRPARARPLTPRPPRTDAPRREAPLVSEAPAPVEARPPTSESPAPPAVALDAGYDAGLLDGGPDAGFDAGYDAGYDAGFDAGVDDAGPPPAPPPPPPAPASNDDAWLGRLERLLFEREAREARRAPRVEAPLETTPRPEPLEREVPVRVVGCDARPGVLGFDFPERRISTFGLVLLLALALLALVGFERIRAPLPERGFLPRLLSIGHLGLRLSAIVMVIMIASRLLPSWLRPALLLSIAAFAIAVGAGAVLAVLPDVVGGIILLTERRLRPGQWIRGGTFEGAIQEVGPRLTVLRTEDGSTLTVPNRHLVKLPVHATDRRWHEVEVDLQMPAGLDSKRVRRAIEDAVHCSPHIPPSPKLMLSRDPAAPTRWRLRARLLDARFAQEFEGQLLERIDEILAASHDGSDEP